MNLQHLGYWNHLEKLAEMFLNTFHREHILLKLKIKKLLRKIKSKNLTAGVFFFFFFKCINMFFTCHFDVCKYVVSCAILALMPAMDLE